MNLYISPLSSLDNRYTFPFFYVYYIISYPSHWHPFTCFFLQRHRFTSETFENQFLDLFFGLYCFLLLISDFPLFYHSFIPWFFLLTSFLLSFSALLFCVFTTLVFSALVSIAFHILLDTLLSLLLLFSNQFQNCSMLAMALHSTSNHQLHLFPLFLYALDNK